jgi:hypothetical protein
MSVTKGIIEDEEDWTYINEKIWVNKLFYFKHVLIFKKKKSMLSNFGSINPFLFHFNLNEINLLF